MFGLVTLDVQVVVTINGHTIITSDIDHFVLHVIVWIDTRDMVADGLTKGAVHRDALHKLMDGSLEFKHESSSWQSKATSSPESAQIHVIECESSTAI